MSATEDDWFVPCRDKEVYKETGCVEGKLKWGLKPAEADKLYHQIIAHPQGIIPLRWACPGRRPPTPSDEEDLESEEDEGEDEDKDTGANAANDFDFEEDAPPSALTPRRPAPGSRELKGSARKKTTSFSNVISNMKRHQKMDAANRSKAGGTPKS